MKTSEELYNRIQHEYRKVKRLLIRKEKIQIETPTQDNCKEIQELNGYLRGLKKSLALVDGFRGSQELNLDGLGI